MAINGKKNKIKYAYDYLKSLLPTALQVICAHVVIGFTAYVFFLFVDDWIIIMYPWISDAFYIFCAALCTVYVVITCYNSAARARLFSSEKANSFRYINGFVIGIFSILPIFVLCVAGTALGYTYYNISMGMEFAKLFFYLFTYPFDSNILLDFSFMQFFLVALAPLFWCSVSYAANGLFSALKAKNKRKEAEQ